MRSPATATHTTSPSWARRAGDDDLGDAEAGQRGDPGDAVALEADERVAGPGGGHDPLDEAHLGARVDPLDAVGVGLDAAQHPLDGPADGGDGGDAEALVDGGPALVVDAGHDALDAEELTGRAGHEDVRVVAVGDRGERAGPLDAGGDQDVAVEADAHEGLAREVLGESTEGRWLAVDHRHGVTLTHEGGGQTGTDPTTPDDDDVHVRNTSTARAGTAADPRTPHHGRKAHIGHVPRMGQTPFRPGERRRSPGFAGRHPGRRRARPREAHGCDETVPGASGRARRWLRRAAGPSRPRSMLAAELISPMWEKAWGKFPSMRPGHRVVLLREQAHVVAQGQQPLEDLPGLVEAPDQHEVVDEPERGEQERALPRRQPVDRGRAVVGPTGVAVGVGDGVTVVAGLGAVPLHEAVDEQLALDGLDRGRRCARRRAAGSPRGRA